MPSGGVCTTAGVDAVLIGRGSSITAPLPRRRMAVATDQVASILCRELGHKGTHVTLFTRVGLALDVGLMAPSSLPSTKP